MVGPPRSIHGSANLHLVGHVGRPTDPHVPEGPAV